MHADADAGHGLPAWTAAAPPAFGLATGSFTVSVEPAEFGWKRASPEYATWIKWSPAATAEATALIAPSTNGTLATWVPSTETVAVPVGFCGVPITETLIVASWPGSTPDGSLIAMSTSVCVVCTPNAAWDASPEAEPANATV